ncbi:uncharacterized protein [Dendrobates tinctorius]|uniref:uncharacterized protein isoform X2 n=1 Tax=Dendrobates tinctorius TaxID=92724 RepID=UPI003CC9ED11
MADKEKEGVVHKCHLCDAQFTNNKEKDTHYNGQFHKFMTGVRRTQLSYMGNSKTLNDQITETGKKESLIGLEYIYEYAEDSQGVRMYECKLCSSAFRVASIFFHIVGIRHRVLYLAKHHPIMGIEDNYEVQQQVHYRKLTNHALAIEQTHGRKKINVVEEVYVSKPNVSEVSDLEIYLVDNIPSIKDPESKKDVGKENSRSRRARERAEKFRDLIKSRERDDDRDDRSRRRDRDSSSSRRDRDSSPSRRDRDSSSSRRDHKELPKSLIHDDDFDARNISQGSSSASRLNLLKDSSAANSKSDRRKRSRSPDRRSKSHSSHRSKFLESSGDIDVRSVLPAGGISFRELKAANVGHLHGGFSSLHLPLCKKKKTTKTDKDSDSDMEVCSMDFSECEPDDFWCNEELFDYLKCYHVGDEEDVQFILEAIKTLSHALVRHKTRMEDLKNWIAQEKQKLEEEKKKFQEMKKRKEDKITSTKICEPEMLKMFNEVTGSNQKPSSNTGKDAQAATQKPVEKVPLLPLPVPGPPVNQPPQLTNFLNTLVAGIPPVVPPATQRPPAVTAPQLVPGPQVAGKAPVQVAQKPLAQNVTPAQQALVSQKALMAGVGQLLQQLFLRPQATANPPNPTPSTQFNIRGPVGGTRPALGAASTTPSQNPQLPGLKFDNPNPSKEQQPFPGQGAGRYPENVVPSHPAPGYQQLPGSSTAPVQQAGPRAPGPETRYAQNPEIAGSRFNNRDPSKEQRPLLLGQGPGGYPAPMNPSQPQHQAAPNLQDAANRFNQNPRSGFDIRGPVDGAGPGSETHFSQNQGPSVSRLDNMNPTKDHRTQVGQAAGRYPESDGRYNQNVAFPGPRTDSAGALNKSGPPLGAGSETHFSQNQGPSVSRFDMNPTKDHRTQVGQAAGKYPESDGRYNQNVAFPGPRTDSAGALNKSGPPLGAGSEAHFSQSQGPSVSRFDMNPTKDHRTQVGQAAGKYPESDGRYNQNVAFPGPRTDSAGALNKSGPPLGAGSETHFSQNQGPSVSRFDNMNPTKDHRTQVGQAAGRYPGIHESDGRYNQNVAFPGPRTDSAGALNKSGPPLGAGSETHFSQNQGPSVSRFDNMNPTKDHRTQVGQAAGRYPESDGRYNQNVAFPGPRTDSAGALNKSGPPLGADAANRFNPNPPSRFDTRGPVDGAGAGPGPITHFSQTQQVPVSRFDNPNVSKDSRSNVGQTAGRNLESDGRYSQNEPYPGARTNNDGSFDKTRPQSGAGSEMRFSQNSQNPGPRFDNSNPGSQPKSLMGQAASRYQEPDNFYSQDDPYPGAWTEKSGSLNKTRPPVGADQQGNYKQTAWNSGPTSGNQGFYNEAQPATGMGTGRYDDQYTQNQWQSQYSSKEQYGAGIDNKPSGPQGPQPQPPASTGYPSEGRPGTWPSAAPAKRGVYPAGILKNKTVNPP